MPHIRRGPTASVSGPAARVPTSVNVCTRLPSTAKTWPRRSSETTCWISVMLQTRPMPFPIPKMRAPTQPIARLGLTAQIATPAAVTRKDAR